MSEATPNPTELRPNLSPAEFARESGLGIATVRRYVKAGKLPRAQPGGERCRVMIPRSALAAVSKACGGNTDDPRAIAAETAAEAPTNRKPRGPKPRWMKPDFNSR
ncbi:MAG: helix-turn-helix domain-containing protein [Planctomycetes bacterium]|nr:helix-turn-helix domain-containing protein [Planctomycetota bacterium]